MNTAKEILDKCHREHCEQMGTTSINPVNFPHAFSEAAIAAMTEHTDLATKALQEENQQLLEWKRQQLEVWGPVDDWGQKNVELGKSIQSEVLKTLEDYQQLKERADKLATALAEIDRIHKRYFDMEGENKTANHLRNIAFSALAAYQTNKNEG